MEQQHTASSNKSCSLKVGMYHSLLRRLPIMVLLMLATGFAWGFSNQVPRIAAQGADEFLVFDFYEPAGWMLNNVQLDRFAFVPTTGIECATTSTCYKIIWREAHAGEWLGLFWIHPLAGGSGGGEWSQPGRPGCNLTGATSVTVLARGAVGGEVVSWLTPYNGGNYVQTPPITLTTTWTRYVIDIAGKDLTNVVGAFGYVLDANDNQPNITFYIDQVAYQGINSAQLACLQATPTPTAPPTATPTATSTTPTATPTATPPTTVVPTFVPTQVPTPEPTGSVQTMVLVYAALDNNLSTNEGGMSWERIVNRLEAGVSDSVHVRLFIDALGPNNSYVYDVLRDNNHLCPNLSDVRCGSRYQEGVNWWRQANDDSAQISAIYNFFKQGVVAAPPQAKVVAVFIGHGNGWSANGLPWLPSRWADQTTGGFLWDDTVDGEVGSRSASTQEIGDALRQVVADTGRKFSLLYLDACSMGMAEVAYELRDTANYLLASPNTDWATFPYHRLLAQVGGDKTDLAVGEAWLKEEAQVLRGPDPQPFTLVLFDLSKMNDLLAAASNLADELIQLLPNQRDLVVAAATKTTRYESNYDGALDTLDTYADLNSFSQQILDALSPASAAGKAATAVKSQIALAVVSSDFERGSPWKFPKQTWSWPNFGGMGVYLPLPQDEEAKRSFYTASNLSWAADGHWDEFLAALWPDQPARTGGAAAPTLPRCVSTTNCATLLASPLLPVDDALYLPLILDIR